jgi:hypothetical protein
MAMISLVSIAQQLQSDATVTSYRNSDQNLKIKATAGSFPLLNKV